MLREIVLADVWYRADLLDCGHTVERSYDLLPARRTSVPRPVPQRRRCAKCGAGVPSQVPELAEFARSGKGGHGNLPAVLWSRFHVRFGLRPADRVVVIGWG